VTTALFNAASPFIVKPFLELEKKDVDAGVNLNVYGAFYFSQKVIPLLLAAEQPSFLAFTGATAALKGAP
jgi:NAD(P)-dependent dehydrogenase (short-subunit alcohol dehydrogenase family)